MEPGTKKIVKIMMDSNLPKQPVNHLPFDDPEAEWIEEPSDEEEVPEGWTMADDAALDLLWAVGAPC